MKKLGLVGGLGPESTLAYYRDIVYGVQERLGQKQFPELIIDSVDVYENFDILESGDLDAYAAWLMKPIERLIASGVDFVAISANTPHVVFGRIEPLCSVPLISIVTATAEAAKALGYTKAALLGTGFTMRGGFFENPFTQAGIELILPHDDEIDFVQEKIYTELEQGIVNPETRDAFCDIAARMRDEDGAQALILGCTELPMLLNDKVSPLPCLDTAQIHVARIIDEIVSS
ncbi:MAG: amino acid racemase [Coriobacteriales bacterium]|nr:amino acid racemase [Coriobacteriales bacterium]